MLRLFGSSLLLIGCAIAAKAGGFPVMNLPHEGKSLQDFVPRGWTIEQKAKGDLNGDGLPDAAMMLIQSKAGAADTDRQRALVVVVIRADGRLVPAGTNGRLLQCEGCGGVKESVAIEIKKGVLIVSQGSGSREFADGTWRFRQDPQTHRFILIGKDMETGDDGGGAGKIESFNYLTGLKIVQDYRLDKAGNRKITKSQNGSVAKETPFLEDVSDVLSQ